MPVLVVQQGHCYRTTGATGTVGEQGYTSKVGAACKALLDGRSGWTVRTILADAPSAEYRGDAFVAVHCDGSTSSAARGASVGYRTPEGQQLGQAWKQAYANRGWSGFRVDNYTTGLSQYYGTNTAVAQGNRRCVVIECGFRTNPDDLAALDAPGGVERVALSIGDALGIPTDPSPGGNLMALSDAEQQELLAGIRDIRADLSKRWISSGKTDSSGAVIDRHGAMFPMVDNAWITKNGGIAPGTLTNAIVSVYRYVFEQMDKRFSSIGAAIAQLAEDDATPITLTPEQLADLKAGTATELRAEMDELQAQLDASLDRGFDELADALAGRLGVGKDQALAALNEFYGRAVAQPIPEEV